MPKTIDILGTPIACVTYETACANACALARRDRPAAIAASNTHIVAAARHRPAFGKILYSFDLILPDGMPLVWTLNAAGAGLQDRVYGPFFMRHMLQHTGRPWRHFFFGGTEKTLGKLTESARKLNPEIDIAGTFSPPFRAWTEADLAEFAYVISQHDPDFIWVALGGERQERWIIENQHRFRRGVFIAIGDAFELLAGSRSFAPDWMQRYSLTWTYRLWQEPRRLWRRYAQYNLLFLAYLALDGARGRAFARTGKSPLRIAFIGSRGAPARYSGFETVVEELGARLVERGHRITVYNRPAYYEDRPKECRGMRLVWLPTIMHKFLETIVHTTFSFLHAWTERFDLIYLCGVGNAPLAWIARLQCRRIIINTDGVDFRREKWGTFAKWWLWRSERMAIHFADRVVVDNGEVVKHYEASHHHTPACIAYGANIPTDTGTEELKRWGLEPGGYILFVSRLTPENEALLLLTAYRDAGLDMPLVLVGGTGYETAYGEALQKLATAKTIFTGPVYGEGYVELSRHCAFFVLPSAVEATRLVVLDQMGFGNAILYRDVEATREVIGDAGEPFATDDLVSRLREGLQKMAADPPRRRELGRNAQARAVQLYDWERVTDRYEELFAEMFPDRTEKKYRLSPSEERPISEAATRHKNNKNADTTKL